MESMDVRGSQGSIFRLYAFDKESLVHMLFYRALIFVALATVVMVVAYDITHSAFAYDCIIAMLIAIWLLFAPQLLEMGKVGALVLTGGLSSSKLNKSFFDTIEKWRRVRASLLGLLPYIALVIWLACLPVMLAVWFYA